MLTLRAAGTKFKSSLLKAAFLIYFSAAKAV